MKKLPITLIFLIFFVLVLAACQAQGDASTQTSPTSIMASSSPTITQNGLSTPEPTSTPVISPSPLPQTGIIKGDIGYPSEVVPAMHIVAYLFGTDTYYTIDTELNQTSYQLDGLPEGNYHVVAYTSGSDTFPAGLAGGYTQAVLCGMEETCTDHSLVNVSVNAGQLVEEANIYDWLIPLPPMPLAGQPVQGAITGRLSYPSEFIPPEKVVAFRLADGVTYSIDTQMNQGEYTLSLPAGTYHVVAYVRDNEGKLTGYAGGYTQAVPCGLAVDCLNHDLIDVVVEQGSVTFEVNPGDFYAPEGAFPPPPG
jgi:hypothetical protein